MENNKSWCPVPWKSVNIRNNGDFRVCCQANTSASKGILNDNDGKVFNAKDANLEKVRNSPLLKEMRLSMLAGKRHDVCLRCNVEDDSNVRSRRSYESEFWKESFTFEDAKRLTADDGFIEHSEVRVGFYDLRFGNLCNLKCRMCGPMDSSLWYKEYFDTSGSGFHDTSGWVGLEADENQRIKTIGDNPYNWHESDLFWKNIEANLDGIRKIYTVGGEPLLIERHYDLLRKLVESGHSKQVIIEYNSNITVIPNRALELWKSFKEVRVGASVDGVGKINEYIRHPSKWETIEKNLQLLDGAPGNLKVWLATTVQIYNIFHLTDILKWKILSNFKKINSTNKNPFITTHPLHSPLHFSIKALPASAKHRVAQLFEQFYSSWFMPYVHESSLDDNTRNLWIKSMKNLLDSYQSLMFKDDLSHHLPAFMEATRRMDLYRKESFEIVMPETADYILTFLKKL